MSTASLKSQLEKLEKLLPPKAEAPTTIVWLPQKDGGGGPALGDHVSADGRALLRIYVRRPDGTEDWGQGASR